MRTLWVVFETMYMVLAKPTMFAGESERRVRDFMHHGQRKLAMVRSSTLPTLTGFSGRRIFAWLALPICNTKTKVDRC